MRGLTVQATSDLLQFAEALGEDELTEDSVLWGKISGGSRALAWLARGPYLQVVNASTGEQLSACHFSGVRGSCPTIHVIKEFLWWEKPGLLIGVTNVLCLYDLERSRAVKFIDLPGKVIAMELITDECGDSVSTLDLHPSLQCFSGVAAVATHVGHLFLVDLCLKDLSWSHKKTEILDLEHATAFPGQVPHLREMAIRRGRHLCFQLPHSYGREISALYFISRTNQLVGGSSCGSLSLWNMGTLKIEHDCHLKGGRIPVCAVTFQETQNDPDNSCYLWAAQSTQKSGGGVVSLRLLQLTFGKRRSAASVEVMYEGLTHCEERFSLDLVDGIFPWAGQTSYIELLSCQTIEDFCNRDDRNISTNGVFSWQVYSDDQENASTYLSVFDFNRWRFADMPDCIRPHSLDNCPYFALWSLDMVTSVASPDIVLDITVYPLNVNWVASPRYPQPEEFVNTGTYNFDGVCLLSSGVVHMTCTGLQTEEQQLEAMLCVAATTGDLELLTGYIERWISDEQPSSAVNLQFLLQCAWNKAVYTKSKFDQICVALFDGFFVDQESFQSLQHFQFLLCNLSRVLNCFPRDSQALSGKGLLNLTYKQEQAGHFYLYTRVMMWFCDSGLFPEGLGQARHSSRPFDHYPLLHGFCTAQRQKLEHLSRGKWDLAGLMIDGIVSYLGERVEKLWRRGRGDGKYPPPSLQALLEIYVLEQIAEMDKHAITIYLLLDIDQAWPNQTETLVYAFSTAFAIPREFVQLIQGFWLLDHNDYESSLALLFGWASEGIAIWLHSRVIQSLMCQGEYRRALTYLRVMKPSMPSSREVQLFLSVMLYNRCMADAWDLLRQCITDSNREELLVHLSKTYMELGLVNSLMNLPFTDAERECLEDFWNSNANIDSCDYLLACHLQQAIDTLVLQSNESVEVTPMGWLANQILQVLPFKRVVNWCSKLLSLLPWRLQGMGTQGGQSLAGDQGTGQTDTAATMKLPDRIRNSRRKRENKDEVFTEEVMDEEDEPFIEKELSDVEEEDTESLQEGYYDENYEDNESS